MSLVLAIAANKDSSNLLLNFASLPTSQFLHQVRFGCVSDLCFYCRPEAYDRGLIHAIESVVIDWTHQIRDVLKKDSAQPLLEGLNPSPMVEIEFWKAKAQNLECIYDQLRDPKVRRMAEMLEKSRSSYYPSFKNIFSDVVEGTDIPAKIVKVC